MDTRVEQAASDLRQAVGAMRQSLDKVPDERLNWSPSPTARSPLHIVAHSAFAIDFIRQMILGRPYPAPTTADADREFLEAEQAISTREQALSLLEGNCEEYCAAIGSLTDDQLTGFVEAPFGLGQVPTTLAITFGGMHTRHHQAQLDYVQTCYGDRAW